jgi:hypothetical protein
MPEDSGQVEGNERKERRKKSEDKMNRRPLN